MVFVATLGYVSWALLAVLVAVFVWYAMNARDKADREVIRKAKAEMDAEAKAMDTALALALADANGSFHSPVRSETVKIGMNLQFEAYERHREAVRTLLPAFDTRMSAGDDLKVNYTFSIDYFGDVVKKLTAVQELCEDPEIISDANCVTLQEGRILCYAVLKKLEAVLKGLKK